MKNAKAIQNVIKMKATLQSLGFLETGIEEPPLETSRWVYPCWPEKIVVTFGELPSGTGFCCFTWYRDAENFSMIPFDLQEDNSDLVRVEALEIVVREHLENLPKVTVVG